MDAWTDSIDSTTRYYANATLTIEVFFIALL